MKQIPGGVTAAKGFYAASCEANIKYTNRTDMALVYSEVPCRAAGVFTSNVVKAACVLWDQKVVESGGVAQAVVVNSGIANACTGKQGYDCCEAVAKAAADDLRIDKEAVLVASTGVIGKQLPTDKMVAGVHRLTETKEAGLEAGSRAAEAIMTTDTVSKQLAVQVELGGKTVTVGGMAKGSGMIHPNMCTMLAFVTTDAAISGELLQKALRADVQDTYNMISVDGDTSTNDTLLVLANGLAGNTEITQEGEDYDRFCQALHLVNETLAKKMAGDGEGATALFEVKVIHARNRADARLLARSVVSSSLTKAAIFGHDANWGRILCAMGYSGAQFDLEKVTVSVASEAGELTLCREGLEADYSEEEAGRILKEDAVTVLIDMNDGEAQATAWGCDLSYDYVKINADYRS